MQVKGSATYFSVTFKEFEKDKQLRDCLNNRQLLHKEIQKMFGTSRSELDILYRIEKTGTGFVIAVKSNVKPDSSKSNLFSRYAHTESFCDLSNYYKKLSYGNCVNFKIEAFPYYYVTKEGKKNPTKRFLRKEEDRVLWLKKKMKDAGLELVAMKEMTDQGQKKISKWDEEKNNQDGYFRTYEFRGRVIVKNESLLANALEKGIGPEKAYGAGLLILY